MEISKSQQLKRILESTCLEFAMEAHSGVSAVIAEEAGFRCLWASGLSMSAMTGCRDRNELDISEVSKVVEWMADHTKVPILVDGDTGGVDPNSARIMVNKLTKAGAAGVCIEDKMYPKHNSFLDNSSSDLADPALHSAKIREMKHENPEFVVVARLESFIAGRDVNDAIHRAVMYQDAGADAILVHSKISTDDEIKAFMVKWNQRKSRIPVVIVPTKYYKTPTDNFRDYGVSLVVWANHQMRASISAMKEVCERIHYEESLCSVEDQIATVNEIFRLQRDKELAEKEKNYPTERSASAIILSSADYEEGVPKCFAKIRDLPILNYLEEGLKDEATKRVDVVTNRVTIPSGEEDKFFRVDVYDYPLPTRFIVNNSWQNCTEVGAMLLGLSSLTISDPLPVFVVYGDLVFKSQIFSRLRLACDQDTDIVLGINPQYDPDKYNEFVVGDELYTPLNLSNTTNVIDFFTKHTNAEYSCGTHLVGSFVGVLMINTMRGLQILKEDLQVVSEEDPTARFCTALRRSFDKYNIKGVYIPYSEWTDVNDFKDKVEGEEKIYGDRNK